MLPYGDTGATLGQLILARQLVVERRVIEPEDAPSLVKEPGEKPGEMRVASGFGDGDKKSPLDEIMAMASRRAAAAAKVA